MDCVVTVLVALGVMPLVLAMMAYLAAREFLLWPFFGARLWGVAVGLILVGPWAFAVHAVPQGGRPPPEAAARGGAVCDAALLAPRAWGLERGNGLRAGLRSR